jgi:hypothetical protein
MESVHEELHRVSKEKERQEQLKVEKKRAEREE